MDGSFDWSAGVNSSGPTSVQSQSNPNGVARNMLVWLVNGTVRGGGITPRAGWQPVCTISTPALYQGGIMYDPPGDSNPYLIVSIGGRILRVRLDTDNSVEDLSTTFGLVNPSTTDRSFFAQMEEFLIIQAGDYNQPGAPVHIVPYGNGVEVGTYPLFWTGGILRRSIGITTITPTQTPGQNELPPATAMNGYMSRMWYARDRVTSAGDIIGGTAGTNTYNFRDSILNVTENPLAFGGDGFSVPTNAKEIRALASLTELDQAVGSGNLYVGTRRAIFRIQVPVTRQDWIAAGSNNQPLITVIQKKYGFLNDRSIVEHNADLFFKAIDGTRSLGLAIRYFNQWGNTAISRNERRLLDLNDRALMRYSSGIEFDNRLFHTEGPIQTPVGPAFRAISVLDFDLLTTLQEKLPPAWEGMYEGLQVLQLFEGDFGGRQRAFAVVYSQQSGNIDLWELTQQGMFENGDRRITMVCEFPAYNFKKDFELSKLDGAALWIDRMFGDVDFVMQYRTDFDPCWRFWHAWHDCSAKNACDDVSIQDCLPDYPADYQESFRASVKLPVPPSYCETATKRPSTTGYQFQPRLIVKGFARLRGLMLFALPTDEAPGTGLVC